MNSVIRLCCCINRVSSTNPAFCGESIQDLLEENSSFRADITLFPRLALCPPSSGAMLKSAAISHLCEESLDQLRLSSAQNGGCIIVGLVKSFYGKLTDVIAVIQNGEVLGFLPACGFNSPNTISSSEGWYPADSASSLLSWDTLFCCGDLKFCICPCPVKDLPLHLPRLAKTGCHAVLVPYYEPATAESAKRDSELVRCLSETFGIAIAFVCGGQGDTSHPNAFQGHAAVYECGNMLSDHTGQSIGNNTYALESFSFCHDLDCDILNACQRFPSAQQPDIIITENTSKKGLLREVHNDPFLPMQQQEAEQYLSTLFQLQVESLVSRVTNTGLHRLVLGVSGGLDSTLALLVCHQALKQLELPSQNLIAITMPGFGTSDRTYYNALSLISALGAENRDISIKASVLQHFEDIGHDPSLRDVTYENAQARERTQILFDVANSCRGLVVGTGDMSEDALGWCTFGGDHLASYNVNVCLTKTMIRKMVTYLCSRFDDQVSSILHDIVDTPVSPELLPPDESGKIQQKTEDILGSYTLHDFFLYYLLKYNFPPKKLYYYACLAFSEEFSASYILEKLKVFLNRFCSGQFKRSCSPDSADITDVCLSRYPIPSDCSAQALLSDLSDIR